MRATRFMASCASLTGPSNKSTRLAREAGITREPVSRASTWRARSRGHSRTRTTLSTALYVHLTALPRSKFQAREVLPGKAPTPSRLICQVQQQDLLSARTVCCEGFPAQPVVLSRYSTLRARAQQPAKVRGRPPITQRGWSRAG